MDKLRIIGKVLVELRDPFGILKSSEVCNVVTNNGKAHIANLLSGNNPADPAASAAMAYMSLGLSSSPSEDPTDTALNSEIVGARRVFDSKTQSGSTCVYVTTWAEGDPSGTNDIVEAGIFNDPTTGYMLARTTFGVKSKGPGDSLTLTWTITIA